MEEYILKTYPPGEELIKTYREEQQPDSIEVNCHVHTPYSFSAFENISQILEQAKTEQVKLIGINDFYSAEGFQEFYTLCLETGIFPMFNIEVVGLIREEQQKNFRINDPSNPGRIYISGKGLDYPFELDPAMECMLHNIRYEIQVHVKEIVENADRILKKENGKLSLKFSEIKRRFARDFVTERHVARAIRSLVYDKYTENPDREMFIKRLLGSDIAMPEINDGAAIENLIRAHFLKSGGRAFIPEERAAFLPVEEVFQIILNGGGIPCYTVLLDDDSGQCTEYEANKQILMNELRAHNIHCIEFLPYRNDSQILKDYARYFRDHGFIILFGTAHSTPEAKPLRVLTRGDEYLDEEMKLISHEGASVVAAHQYLRARGEQGYLGLDGKPLASQPDELIELGKSVIHRFTRHHSAP